MTGIQKYMRRTFLAMVLTPLLLLLAFAVLQPRSARSYAVAFEDFEEIAPGVFVDRDFGAEDADARTELLSTLDAARERVAVLFGEPARSRPNVIVSDDPERIDRYMGNLFGATHTSPLGAVVVLGPNGRRSIDVAAHELVHAEHFERAGYWRYLLDTPMWFVEGLGMQVDYRERYAEAAWNDLTAGGSAAPALEDLTTSAEFTRGDLTANYATARREVAAWLGPRSASELRALVESWGFESTWSAPPRGDH